MMAGKRVVIPGVLAKAMVYACSLTPKALLLASIAALRLRRTKEPSR